MRTNRREFVGAAATFILLQPAQSAFALTRSEKGSIPSYYKLIFDERVADCLSFAAEAERLGGTTHGIRGDVTSLWYDDLYYRWREGTATAIAGLTLEPAAFCLRVFARDAGLHPVLHGDHFSRGRGCLEHRIEAPEPFIRSAPRLTSSGPYWSAELARLLCGFDGSKAPKERFSAQVRVTDYGDTRSHLVSWALVRSEGAPRLNIHV